MENDYAFRKACEIGHYNIAEYLIKLGANLYAENNFAMIKACKNGHSDIVTLLINSGFNVNTKNYYINIAYSNFNYEIVDIFKNLIINKQITNIYPSIKKASSENQLELIKFYYNNFPENIQFLIKELIYYSCSNGYLDQIKFYDNIDIEYCFDEVMDPLLYHKKGNYKIVKYYLNKYENLYKNYLFKKYLNLYFEQIIEYCYNTGDFEFAYDIVSRYKDTKSNYVESIYRINNNRKNFKKYICQNVFSDIIFT